MHCNRRGQIFCKKTKSWRRTLSPSSWISDCLWKCVSLRFERIQLYLAQLVNTRISPTIQKPVWWLFCDCKAQVLLSLPPQQYFALHWMILQVCSVKYTESKIRYWPCSHIARRHVILMNWTVIFTVDIVCGGAMLYMLSLFCVCVLFPSHSFSVSKSD